MTDICESAVIINRHLNDKSGDRLSFTRPVVTPRFRELPHCLIVRGSGVWTFCPRLLSRNHFVGNYYLSPLDHWSDILCTALLPTTATAYTLR